MDIPISSRDVAGPAQQAASAQIQNDPAVRPPPPVAPVPKSQAPKNEIDDGKRSAKKTSSRRTTVKKRTGSSRHSRGQTPAFVVNLQHQNQKNRDSGPARTKDLPEQGESLDRGPSREIAAENGVRPEESRPSVSRQDDSAEMRMMNSSSESQSSGIHGPGGPYSVTLDGLASTVNSPPDSPEEMARKMDMVRRAMLMTGERDGSEHLAAMAAVKNSAGARWEIVQEQRAKASENMLPGQEARAEARAAAREELREADKEEEEEKRESKTELPSFPDTARYAVPLSDNASFYTPRFSEPTRTQFNSKALDAKSGLGGNSSSVAQSSAVRREMSLARQSFKRATAASQAPRPMIQVRA